MQKEALIKYFVAIIITAQVVGVVLWVRFFFDFQPNKIGDLQKDISFLSKKIQNEWEQDREVQRSYQVHYVDDASNFEYAKSDQQPQKHPDDEIYTCDFEVFGKVQHVYFRKYTKQKADSLGISGWIMNTEEETVMGQIIGKKEKFMEMKKWLEYQGSPKSKITKAQFTNMKIVNEIGSPGFYIRKQSF